MHKDGRVSLKLNLGLPGDNEFLWESSQYLDGGLQFGKEGIPREGSVSLWPENDQGVPVVYYSKKDSQYS